MIHRDKINALYTAQQELQKSIDKLTREYLAEAQDSYIYLTDHVLSRYIERVREFPRHGETDRDYIALYCKVQQVSIAAVRNSLLGIGEQRFILEKKLKYYKKDNYTVIIEGLTAITVTKKADYAV